MIVLKRWPQSCALVLVLSLVLSGCYAPAGPFVAANITAGRAALAPSERSDIVNALKAAAEELKIIDDLIADKDLGLLEEEDPSDTSEMTEEDIAFYMGVLEEYNGKIKAALTDIKGRQDPINAQLAAFRTAEIAQFELAGDVVEEYMQVLHYIQSLLDLAVQMEAIGQVSATDPAGMYEGISQAIDKAVKDLEASAVPTFLKSMNDSMVASLSEMNEAVLYSLIAEEINDPLRRNGAAYRMGILERKFTRISDDADKDTEGRMEKLKEDIRKIQQVNEGLTKWVKANLDELGN